MTESLVVLLFMKVSDINGLDDIPDGMPVGIDAKVEWLQRQSRLLVDSVYNPTNVEDVKQAMEAMAAEPRHGEVLDDANIFPFCICREGD